MEYEEAITFESLLESMYKCQRGVLWKESVSSFSLNGLERCLKLSDELESGTYRERPGKIVHITSPKPRDALSISFRDRVYQRSLNDNIVYPAMTNGLIYDNGACQRGKGVDFERERIKCLMQRYMRKNGLNGYVLQCDIKGYFNNIEHSAANKELERKLKCDCWKAVTEILAKQYSGDRGYNPGSQMVQIIGISLLNDVDHAVKERGRAKQYWRYMDDFAIISADRNFLEKCKKALEVRLSHYSLHLHPKKTRIYPFANGIETLGFRFRPTESGKVVMSVLGQNVKNKKRKLRRLVKRCKAGKMSRQNADKSFECWVSHIRHGDSYKLEQRMRKFYRSLWEGAEHEN